MQAVAAFPKDSSPRFVEVAVPPSPGEGQVLCRTIELGVCGTDREILLAQQPLTPPGSAFLVLGHESLAEVVETGRQVESLKPGDLVVPAVRRTNRSADVRVDLLPFGSYTERGIVWEHGFSQPLWLDEPRHMFKVATGLRSSAVLTEPLAVAAKAIHEALAVQQGRLGPATWTANAPRVLVTGMGPIGFAALLGACRRGWPTTMLGRDQPETFRAQLAQRFGAAYRTAAAEMEKPESFLPSGDQPEFEYDLILECTGSEQVIVQASSELAPCGAMVWLGSARAPQPCEVNLARMVRDGLLRNHVHIGSVNAAARDFVDALATLAHFQSRQPGELAQLVTARVELRDALWHYEHRQSQGIKTVVEYPT